MANALSDLFFLLFFFFFFAFFPNKTIWLALHHLCLPYSSPFPCLASNTHTLTHRYTTHSRSCKSILSHLPTLTHWHTHTPKFTHTHTPKFTYAVVFTSIEIQKNIPSFSGSPTLFLKIGTLKTLEQVLKKTLYYFLVTSFKTITDMTIS